MRPDILTGAGYFNFTNPASYRFDIEVIAHSLSNLCRFTGHTRKFYSVAQHSVLVSDMLPYEFGLIGLLHDAAEAFVGDVSAPLKQLLPDYKEVEKRVEHALFSYFKLPSQLPPIVKRADLIVLATEQRDLMPPAEDNWQCLDGIDPLSQTIVPMHPEIAERLFLDRYYKFVAGAEKTRRTVL